MRVSLTPQVLGYGLLGIGIILLIQVLLPTLSAAENTIVTYKQERARSLRAPWWQKFYLDMLIPAGYGLWQLNQQSQQALSGSETIPDPLQNPLLLLVPALGIFSVALFTLRLVPRFMDFIARFLNPSNSVGLLMAARYLARSPALYNAPLVLLVLTLGLSAFTASLARTLDSQLDKQIHYQVGADINLYEFGTTFNEDNPNPVYTFGPIDDHLSIHGVEAATPVGRYKFTGSTPSGSIQGVFLGIESGDQRILNAMNKSAKLERYRYGIKRLNELGIVTFGAFIVGYPSETDESARNTLEFIQSTQPMFYTPQIYYHDLRSPVHKQAQEFGITSSGYSWTHKGMDWKTASSWVLQMIRDIPDSTPIPLYSMSLWGILYLVEHGFSVDVQRKFGNIAREMLIAGYSDQDPDQTDAFRRLTALVADVTKDNMEVERCLL